MFIPQMVFLACIFIYLCLEIVVKWIWFTAGVGLIISSMLNVFENMNYIRYYSATRFHLRLQVPWFELRSIVVDWTYQHVYDEDDREGLRGGGRFAEIPMLSQ